jgi:hypothetical protein
VSYQVQLANNSAFSSPALDKTIESNSITLLTMLADGVYYWRVKQIDIPGRAPSAWSAVWSVRILQPIPAAPVIIEPVNDAVDISGLPVFSWASVLNGVTYEIQVADNDGFSTPIIDNTAVTTSRTLALLSDGDYYWRVRAINAYATPGEWSPVNMLRIDVPPAAPGLVAPENEATDTTGTPTFSWEDVTEAVTYQLQVANEIGFGSPILDETVMTTDSTSGTPLENGTYYWRVRAINVFGKPGDWSEIRELTVTVP